MAQPTRKEPTIEEVRAKIEAAFAADVEIAWDARANGYRLQGVTDHGQVFVDLYHASRTDGLQIIHQDELEQVLQLAGHSSLTIQLELDEEEEEF